MRERAPAASPAPSPARRRWPGPDRAACHERAIDPATGEPGGNGLLAVTVAAPDPAWAEVWSKALFLASAGRIAGAARARGLAAWWVDQVGRLSMTPAARLLTPWVGGERPG